MKDDDDFEDFDTMNGGSDFDAMQNPDFWDADWREYSEEDDLGDW